MEKRGAEGGRRPDKSDATGGRECFRVVTEEFPDRIEVRVEEQEWVENFGWINCPKPSSFPRFRVVLRRQPGWLARLARLLRPDRARAEAAYRHGYERRLERALVAAQMEANRRNADRNVIAQHLETVREVFKPEDGGQIG